MSERVCCVVCVLSWRTYIEEDIALHTARRARAPRVHLVYFSGVSGDVNRY